MVRITAVVAILLVALNCRATDTQRWFNVTTTSMEPTILRGEKIGVNDRAFEAANPHRGDIVAYRDPLSRETVLFKRIVALPFETVEIRHKQLFINGKPLDEPYVVHNDSHDYSGSAEEPYKSRDTFGPLSLALNEYFVLGDNRDSSMDSRYHGAVARALLVGKVEKVRSPSGVREVR